MTLSKTFLTFDKIKILKIIVEEQNLTLAAKVLNTSQTNLSLQLKILEDEANLELFIKKGNEISLTENGEILYRYSTKIYALYEELLKIISHSKENKLTHLSLGGDSISSIYLLPKLIAIFKKKYKDAKINLEVCSKNDMAKKIYRGILNLGIIRGNIDFSLKTFPNIEIYPFAVDFLILITSKFQPLSFHKLILLKHQLYDLNWIAFPQNSENRNLIDGILRKNHIFPEKFNTILELESLESIKEAVESGLGVAFLPLLSVQKELHFKTLKSFTIKNFKSEIPLYLMLNLTSYNINIVHLFLKEIDNIMN